jgi:hypothetical protein
MADSTETIISWNVANWVSVVLMAAVFFAALSLLTKWMKARQQAAQGGGLVSATS